MSAPRTLDPTTAHENLIRSWLSRPYERPPENKTVKRPERYRYAGGVKIGEKRKVVVGTCP